MSEIAKYLRFLIQADKEAKITAVSVTETPTKFESQLTSEQTRKGIGIYNNSNASSGECYYSFSELTSPSGESMPIPKGSIANIPIADVSAIELYLLSDDGEVGDLRVIEVA